MAKHSSEPWTWERKGSVEEGEYEYVIHLSDKSRGWDSCGWPDLHRIIVYGDGIGEGQICSDEIEEAEANVRLMTAAPLLLKCLGFETIDEFEKVVAERNLPCKKQR